MAISFLSLPPEIRLDIYSFAFGSQIDAVLTADRQDLVENTETALLPAQVELVRPVNRSAQLLRVCKTILFEARPLLYANTTFHVRTRAFAGRLPATLTDGFPAAAHVRNLTWQINCDMLKYVYLYDLQFDASSLTELSSLEIRCQCESWKSSHREKENDYGAVVRGEEAMLTYAEAVRKVMSEGSQKVALVEDKEHLDDGGMRIRLQREAPVMRAGEEPVD